MGSILVCQEVDLQGPQQNFGRQKKIIDLVLKMNSKIVPENELVLGSFFESIFGVVFVPVLRVVCGLDSLSVFGHDAMPG